MDNNNIDPRDVLDNALNTLLNKYGLYDAINRLNIYINTGNNKCFSRDNGDRDNVTKYLTSNLVKEIVTKASHTTEDYDLYVYERILGGAEYEFKTSVLNEASEATLEKYEKTNPNQLKNAIKQAIINNDYHGFSRGIKTEEDIKKKKNLQYKLKNTVKPNEMEKIIKIHLQKEGINVKNMNTNEIIDLYNTSIENRLHSVDTIIDLSDDKLFSNEEEEKVERL
ncbi:MAG: hypothetical protein IJF92_05580 [Bacilli bacterium]|nr:hypothetical protein [Bacilli bacterium]